MQHILKRRPIRPFVGFLWLLRPVSMRGVELLTEGFSRDSPIIYRSQEAFCAFGRRDKTLLRFSAVTWQWKKRFFGTNCLLALETWWEPGENLGKTLLKTWWKRENLMKTWIKPGENLVKFQNLVKTWWNLEPRWKPGEICWRSISHLSISPKEGLVALYSVKSHRFGGEIKGKTDIWWKLGENLVKFRDSPCFHRVSKYDQVFSISPRQNQKKNGESLKTWKLLWKPNTFLRLFLDLRDFLKLGEPLVNLWWKPGEIFSFGEHGYGDSAKPRFSTQNEIGPSQWLDVGWWAINGPNILTVGSLGALESAWQSILEWWHKIVSLLMRSILATCWWEGTYFDKTVAATCYASSDKLEGLKSFHININMILLAPKV